MQKDDQNDFYEKQQWLKSVFCDKIITTVVCVVCSVVVVVVVYVCVQLTDQEWDGRKTVAFITMYLCPWSKVYFQCEHLALK